MLRRLALLREIGMLQCDVVAVKDFLDEEDCSMLSAKGIRLCTRSELLTEIEIGAEETDGTGTGDSSGNHRRCSLSEL